MKKEILNSITILQKGDSLLYPTDTVWGIGCDATNESAVKKVFQIKQRHESKSLIILVDSIKMLQSIIKNIPAAALEIISKTSKPTSIIYYNPKGLAKNVIASDNTVAIRIVHDEFCQQLIQEFGKPIVSSSANISGSTTPNSFSDIHIDILQNVDYVVNLHRDKQNTKSSRIVKIKKNGCVQIIRD